MLRRQPACRWHNTAIDDIKLLIVVIVIEEVALKMFPAILPPISHRSLPQNQSIADSERSRRFGQDFLDRAIGSAQLPIMDTCLGAFFCFSPFFLVSLAPLLGVLFTSSREKITSDQFGAQ